MARGAHIDKYDPISGGHRAPLAAATTVEQIGVPLAVSLDANGRVVIGTAGNSGYIGVLVVTKVESIGTVVDIMQSGEIVDVANLAAGTKYYAGADGALNTTNTNPLVGWTVEADRLVVRARPA